MHSPDQTEALVDAIRERAWNFQVKLEEIPSQMKSMILWPEQKLLHWLTRDYYRGQGLICDLGCFVGSSTLSLASGLKHGSRRDSVPLIHSYDMFIAPDDPYTLQRLPEGFKPGDSFKRVFEDNIASHKEWIEIHDGDLRLDPWTGGPVEILFIDICKCWSTNSTVLANFFPSLVPGRGIVIHQDFVRVWNPSIRSSPPHTATVHKGALAMLVFMEGDPTEAHAILDTAIKDHPDNSEAQLVFGNLKKTMDYWKTGEAYEHQMEAKF